MCYGRDGGCRLEFLKNIHEENGGQLLEVDLSSLGRYWQPSRNDSVRRCHICAESVAEIKALACMHMPYHCRDIVSGRCIFVVL